MHLFFTYYNSYPNDPPKHKEKHKENRQSVDFSDSLGLETVNHEENDDDQQNLYPYVIGRHRNQLRDDLLEAEIEGSADKFALFGLGGAAAVLPVPFPVGLLSERAEDEVAEHLEKVAKQARDQKQHKKPAKACASDELLASLPSPCLASLLLSSFPKVEGLPQRKPRSPGDL